VNKIHKMRLQANLTQEELAEKVFVDRSTVAKWETGKAQPRVKTLLRLAVVLHCTTDELISNRSSLKIKHINIESYNNQIHMENPNGEKIN